MPTSAKLQRVVAELDAKRLDEEPLGACLDTSGHDRRDALCARHLDRALGIGGLHEEREAGAHVEGAVGLAIALLCMPLYEFQHRCRFGHAMDAVSVRGRMAQQLAPAVAGDVGAVV